MLCWLFIVTSKNCSFHATQNCVLTLPLVLYVEKEKKGIKLEFVSYQLLILITGRAHASHRLFDVFDGQVCILSNNLDCWNWSHSVWLI